MSRSGPRRNRVTPFGEIVAIPQRGTFMGNRGALYRGDGIGRPWNGRRWICCVLEYKGWRAPPWGAAGRWTALFFLDEAVALAAGHRPCALCRRADYERFLAASGLPGAEELDRRLHADRLDADGRQRRHTRAWGDLPAGAFVVLGDGRPARVEADHLVPWTVDGYGPPLDRPTRGDATVLTPSLTVDSLRSGYRRSEPAVTSAPIGAKVTPHS